MKIFKIAQSITAYHGTCEGLYNLILEEDWLKNPYLARNIDLAKYYAEEASINYRCGKPIILEVTIPDISNLRYDKNSMDEPVMASEEDRDEAWNLAAKQHPEWYNKKDDMVSIPSSEWEISWDAVGSVWYAGFIPLNYIKKIL